MNLYRFKIFAAVAEHLNITKASKRLRISQPGVTKQLKRLETEYGVKLYQTHSRGIELTGEGRIFVEGCGPSCPGLKTSRNSFPAKQSARAD